MKNLWLVLCLAAVYIVTGCDGSKQDDSNEKAGDVLKQQEAVQDTTLQKVEEISIRAIGGEDTARMAFDQDTLEVKAGSLVRLELINEGTDPKMILNIVFIRPGLYQMAAEQGSSAGASGNYLPDSAIMLAASPLALPGQTVSMEFTAPLEPGDYDFVSTYPGDHQKLRGKLIVK
ncbi:plastocyanin/azurin family copper-binding protein [Pontibacter aquaedesilientis]|uniref:plastocyanin/azurin family copper-binding protein n=1 Tax=Pontibacter aquaedesilientis TaxID=2766980 RepID=UPI00293BF526|nr:plastocyanin/azurin family copper-binding protein [Pontibacter aquaedesilientis]